MVHSAGKLQASILGVSHRAWAIGAAMMGVMIVCMLAEGRRWWCACESLAIWKGDVWSSHCSQHVVDPYSFTHFSHGLIFAVLLGLFARHKSIGWQLCAAIAVAAAWEVAENTPFVIERYRSVTMSLDYLGDSIVNAIGDVLCCIAGFFVARKLGVWKTAALFVAIEIALLILIKDNLTLNVLMLLWPVDAIKHWQAAGHLVIQ